MNSGLMPNGSRARNSFPSSVSQMAKANMPRSLLRGLGAPVVEGRHDGLAVTLGAEHRRIAELGLVRLLQLGAQLEVVVDLAVEGHGVPLGILRRTPAQRLVRVLDIDDRQAVEAEDHAEDHAVIGPGTALVGATMALAVQRLVHLCRGGFDRPPIRSSSRCSCQKSEQTTHCAENLFPVSKDWGVPARVRTDAKPTARVCRTRADPAARARIQCL